MEKFISSDLFANLCQFFSAVGTVAAVVVSLYLSCIKTRIKFRTSGDTIDIINPNGVKLEKKISGYCVKIVNCSDERNIYLKQGLYYIPDSLKKKKGFAIILPIVELNHFFPIQKDLGPGDEFEFFLSKTQIMTILDDCKKKQIKLFFVDKYNRKYYVKVERSQLKKRLDYLEKNKKEILDFN